MHKLSRKTFATNSLKLNFVWDLWFYDQIVNSTIEHLSNIDEIEWLEEQGLSVRSALTKHFIMIVHTVGSLRTRTIYFSIAFIFLKFIYSEKATKFWEISNQLFDWQYIGQIIGGDFARFCGLLRIYEL